MAHAIIHHMFPASRVTCPEKAAASGGDWALKHPRPGSFGGIDSSPKESKRWFLMRVMARWVMSMPIQLRLSFSAAMTAGPQPQKGLGTRGPPFLGAGGVG